MRLTTEVDQSGFGTYLTQHQGKVVPLTELRKVITQTFGTANSEKIYLGCKNGILVDIYIQLPALLPQTDSLIALINSAPNNRSHDMCGSKVTISHFNKDSWF
jgi:ribonuclease T2